MGWPTEQSYAATDEVQTTTPRSPSTGSLRTIASAAGRMTL